MTDRTDADGADDGTDELDRHARAAASALLTQIDELVADDEIDWSAGAEAAAVPPAPLTHASVPEARDPQVIPLDRAPGRPAGRTRRRRTLGWAAAVAALVALGGAIAVADRDGEPDVTSGGPGSALLPGWLPDGLEPVVATNIGQADLADTLDGKVTVYGDPDATDPWEATLAVTHLVVPAAMAGALQPDVGEAVTVAGHDATLSEMDGRTSGTRGPGWRVQWRTEDGMVGVAGTNMTRDEVLTAAAEVTDGPGIAADGLPARFTELARGPLDAATPSLGLSFPSAGLTISYGAPDQGDEGDSGETMIAIIQRPAPASAVDLLQAFSSDSEAITVRGHDGVVSRDDRTGVVVQWAEPEGQLVTVIASGVTEDAALQVVERMQPAEAEEVEALLTEHAPPSAGGFDDLTAGQVEVASGAVSGGGAWRVVADPAAGESMDALAIEQVSTDGSSSSSGSSGGMGGAAAAALELWTDSTEAGTVVYGLVVAEAATVTLEAPGQRPVPLDLHTVDGWSRHVVASLVANTGPEAVAIARTADGREVARTTVYGPGPDPITPDPSDPTATEGIDTALEETCVTAPDGSVTCSSGDSAPTATIVGDG